MQYVIVEHEDIGSPVEEGLYELIDGSYVLSEDEEVYEDKTYYMVLPDDDPEVTDYAYADAEVEVGEDASGLYEYDSVSDTYILTSDITVQAGKEYFVLVDQRPVNIPDDEGSRYYIVEEEVENPFEAGLYEIVDDVYTLTEDTVYDAEKKYYRQIVLEGSKYAEVDTETGDAVEGLYEYDSSSGSYILTEDITAQMGKHYFELVSDFDIAGEDEYDPLYSLEDVVPEGVKEEPIVALPEDFLFAWLEVVENPQLEGLYEVVNGAYVLTSDTEVVEGKTYFEYKPYSDYYAADMSEEDDPSYSLIRYYELLNGAYVLTQDTAVLPGKTYYRSHKDDEHPFVPDPMIGEELATYDDVPYEE